MKTFVLGIDGLPYSFLKDIFEKGRMPHLAKMFKTYGAKQINSVYPTVSSVAWVTYMTGKNPAEHNIFGFADRTPAPFQLKIPTTQDRKATTVWQELSRQGKKVIVINVPLTYPPEEVNGILISCFLCPDINKVSYPAKLSSYLKSKDYIIDVDTRLARESKEKFMKLLHKAMEKRFEIAFELMAQDEWDFFQLHIMETDRLFHFFWHDLDAHGQYYTEIISFFEKLDNYIRELEERLSDGDRLLILSDHGFCGLKAEVQLNTWLEKQGLLRFSNNGDKRAFSYEKDSICYSLLPGRIFINLEGREEYGSVKKSDYAAIRKDIKQRLLGFIHPETKENIIDKIFFREEIYSGPYLENAADIIVHPENGYDLKGRTDNGEIFVSTALNGMHTYDDAFLCAKNCDIKAVESIKDIKEALCKTA